MTREIKFRAWDGQEMRAVNGIQFKSGGIKYVRMYGFRDPLKAGHNVTLMQYTGLKDTHGREIYEGDIIQHHDHAEPLPRAVVRWIAEDAGFGLGIGTPSESTEWYEVMGNIYENPELLEAGGR